MISATELYDDYHKLYAEFRKVLDTVHDSRLILATAKQSGDVSIGVVEMVLSKLNSVDCR